MAGRGAQADHDAHAAAAGGARYLRFRAELADFPFSPAVSVHWLTDGDHGFKPRKASGMSEQENLRQAAERIKDFIAAVGRS
jgi:predicted alpha/beta-hydrolase family hydrolase